MMNKWGKTVRPSLSQCTYSLYLQLFHSTGQKSCYRSKYYVVFAMLFLRLKLIWPIKPYNHSRTKRIYSAAHKEIVACSKTTGQAPN